MPSNLASIEYLSSIEVRGTLYTRRLSVYPSNVHVGVRDIVYYLLLMYGYMDKILSIRAYLVIWGVEGPAGG